MRCCFALILCAILTCAILAEAGQADSKKAAALFDKGVKAAQAGELEQAEALFRKALDTYALLPGAYVELGKIQMARGKPAEAVEQYLKARETYVALHNEKVAQLTKKQTDDRQWVEEGQGTQSIGGFAKQSGQKAREQRLVDNREIVIPEQEADIPALFYLYLGGAYLRLNKADLAETELRLGTAKDGKMAPMRFNLSVACMIQGKYEEAAAEARKARELGFQLPPQFVTDLETRGKLKL